MTYGCPKIMMRPASRYYAILFVLAYFVLMAHLRHELDMAKLQLQTIGSSHVTDRATAIDVVTNQNKTKVSYVTSFWAKVKNAGVHPHRRESEAAVLANIRNPQFDQVVVFLVDRETEAETCVYFHQEMSDLYGKVFSMAAEESKELLDIKLTCVDVQTGQPTYYQMFHNALSDVVTGDVVVLANADMAFDYTISLARHLNPEVLVTLETRGFSDKISPETKWIYERVMGKDLPEEKPDRCLVTGASIDTWIFHKSAVRGKLKEQCYRGKHKNKNIELFYMNGIGAENAALWALTGCVPFTSIYNACDRMHAWHFHLTPEPEVPNPTNAPFPPRQPKCIRDGNCFYGLEPQAALPANTLVWQQTEPQAMPATVSYVTSFWAERRGVVNHPHRLEIRAALLANILNPHFDQVVIFLDGVSEEASCSHFLEEMMELSLQLGEVLDQQIFNIQADPFSRVTCVGVQGAQPSYYQMFQNTFHHKVTGDIVVLANADQVFDDTISLTRYLNPEVLLLLGTRGFSNKMPPTTKYFYDTLVHIDYVADLEQHETGEWNTDMCRETMLSWDTWIFHKSKIMGRLNSENFKRLNQNDEFVPFYMNDMGAENAALWAVQRSNLFASIHHACDDIHSWHFHLTPKTHTDRVTAWAHISGNVPPPYFYVRETPDVATPESSEIPEQEVSLARLRRDEQRN